MAYQVTTGRFVGRTQELARLGELLARVTGGEPLLVLLGGEAGVGKTRLAEQLAASAAQQGVLVLGGGCVPLGEEGMPFAPVIQALRGLADQLDAAELEAVAGPARHELGRLLPDLAWSGEAAADAGATGAGQAGQGRLSELLVGVIGRLAASAPLLWVLEDLHWADRSTRDLLAYLATSLRSGRVLLVGTFRSDELHRRHPLRRLLGELGRNRRVVRLELPRFTRAEVAEQLAGLLGAEAPARLVEDVYARSGGNPFFAEELLLASDGGGPGGLPPSLREVLLARVVRLGDRTQRLLRVAAAAGPGVTQPLLAAVAGMDDQQLLDGLHEAVDQQLLLPDPAGGDGYVFRHALLAEAVYAELLAGERVRLHTALAGALEAGLEAEEAPASRAARLAYHWAAAGDQPRALSASVQAADAAEQVYAFAEAQLQLERILALWDQVPHAEARAGMDRVALLARCAEAAYGVADFTRAAELVRQALGLVDAARQPQRAGLLYEQLARCLRRVRDPAALDAQEQAVRLVPPGRSVERARVLGSLARLLVLVDRFAEVRGPAEEAAAVARKFGARAEEADARTALGAALGYLGHPDAGLAELAAAVRLATQAGDVIVVLRALISRSDGLVAAGRPEEAVVVALDGLDEARRLGLARSYGPVLAANATEALVALGRWDQADQVSRQALEAVPSDAVSVHLPLVRAALELGRGDLDAAQARLQAMRRLLPGSIRGAQLAGPLLGGLVELALWRGDLDQAKQLVVEAVPQVAANPRHAAPLYALGLRVEADRAELARARHPHQPAPNDATATTLLDRLTQAAASPAAAGLPELAAWHALGLAERTRRQRPADPAAWAAAWAAAVAAWERLGQPYRAAYAGFRHAEALLAAGDRDAAAAVLRRAAEATGRLGARPLDSEIHALARRARLDLAPPAPPAPAAQLGLTPREAEVLALVAAGHSNRQVAQALFISPKTASVHVSNILAKLGVATRGEAAAIAHRLGLD
jgi:DNA-binding CsgD family transcriptional regulator/tetratricopeptide (TPR) repeat protein